MTTQTRERNYRKNPHTARFLQTFHASTSGLPSDIEAEADDLLDLVPAEAPAYVPSPRQTQFMCDLVLQINELDAKLGQQAKDYTARRAENGTWTPERVSEWIDRLIAKRAELREVAIKATTPATVADGRYAVEEGGELKFFKVKNGRRPGFVFLDIQASDDWHAIRNVTRIRAILALIAADADGASLRYGRELGVCGDCGRTLTSEWRLVGRGPICSAKH